MNEIAHLTDDDKGSIVKLYSDFMAWLNKLKADIAGKQLYEDPLDYNLDQIQTRLETVKYEC